MHFLQNSALLKSALFEEPQSSFHFVCPHFEKNYEAVDHNDAGNENGETDDF